ncbi:hypothetical protein D3C78_1868150 [compost metagenome]
MRLVGLPASQSSGTLQQLTRTLHPFCIVIIVLRILDRHCVGNHILNTTNRTYIAIK